MQRSPHTIFVLFVLVLIVISLACATFQPAPTSTPAPEPTATKTAIPPTQTNTPRPTWTPDLAATQHVEELDEEAQAYYEKGYLATTHGTFRELEDFSYDWAQLGWYNWLPLPVSASDFFLSAHFSWDSAYRNSNTSGCGFVFSLQENKDHYAVFLDRMEVLFLMTDRALGASKPVGLTRGTGTVKFSYPAEADFTLIVKDVYAYVLVNDEVVGEYTLAQSRPLRGGIGLTVLSGTNKDFGTRCEMTNLRLWTPDED